MASSPGSRKLCHIIRYLLENLKADDPWLKDRIDAGVVVATLRDDILGWRG